MEEIELRKLRKRIEWMIKNKVNSFSPTISPAPKNKEEIESIEEAILYFWGEGVKDLVVQRKYMGSYCDIYLKKDLKDSYFVSRNGFKINHINLEEALESLEELHKSLDWDNTEMYLISSELMPWAALGEGLILDVFTGYLISNETYWGKINELKISEKINKLKNIYSEKDLPSEKPHIIRQGNCLKEIEFPDIQNRLDQIKVYKEQLRLYGTTGKIYFKPFGILKIIHTDGTETIPNDNTTYSLVNPDEYLKIENLSETTITTEVEKVKKWFNKLKMSGEEGIVIKPKKAFIQGLPAGLKVRNLDYLVLIYGIDFIENYDSYIRKRNISGKLSCSIQDWRIEKKLLEIKYSDFHQENYYLKNLLLDRILGEIEESKLDKRL